jgi:hypothetical protein
MGYVDLISENTRIARKEYHCDACELVHNDIDQGHIELLDEFTDQEKHDWQKAKDSNYRIKKGEKYIIQVCKFDGIMYSVRMKPEIYEIIKKHKIVWEE